MLHDPRWQKQLDDILPQPNAAQLILIQAKATIEKYGWLQGDFGSMETGFCLMGAVDHVIRARNECPVFDGVYIDGVYDAVEKAIGTKSVGGWNDIPGRTKRQVLAAFDIAIAAAG